MNSTSIRTQTSQQYFELRTELNRANRTKNLKTELEFEIRENEDEHFIVIKSTGAVHGLRLANRYKTAEQWIMFENAIYADFYKYMFLKIRQLNLADESNINITLTNWLLRLWMI